eukprot:365960-Chlamydomonas_euryale.AAC.12
MPSRKTPGVSSEPGCAHRAPHTIHPPSRRHWTPMSACASRQVSRRQPASCSADQSCNLSLQRSDGQPYKCRVAQLACVGVPLI